MSLYRSGGEAAWVLGRRNSSGYQQIYEELERGHR